MTYKEIQELIKLFNKSNLGELNLEQDKFKLKLRSNESAKKVITSTTTPVSQVVTPPVVQATTTTPTMTETTPVAEKSAESNAKSIKAPMIGTFYRASGPDKDPFVKVGDKIEVGQVICIIEAMKLFNEIESEVSGTITKVLVNDATPVEYDQPLFEIE